MEYMVRQAPEVLRTIHETKTLDQESEAALLEAVTAFKAGWFHE